MPVTLPSPISTARTVVALVRRLNAGPDLAETYDEFYREWIGDLAEGLTGLAGSTDLLAERLDALEADHERMRVVGNYGMEAWREAVDDRRRMLRDATVATVFSELTPTELARIERTIRMLDPEDLPTLRQVAADNWRQRYSSLSKGHLGGASLVASGCLRLVPGASVIGSVHERDDREELGPIVATVTPLGELVLKFLHPTVRG